MSEPLQNSRIRVLADQAGARHNYAIPAAFASQNMLEGFYTDMCGDVGLGKFVRALSRLVPLPSAAKALAARKLPKDVSPFTKTDDWNALKFEFRARRAKNFQEHTTAMELYDTEHGEWASRQGLGDATHLFTCFGGGGQLIDDARAQGVTILTDVIIALSTDRIFKAEHEAFPDWGPSPRSGTEYRAKSLVEKTDIFVCPSAFVADDLVENWGVDREDVRIIPYALSNSWFELNPKHKVGQILFVGSADLRKGIHYLAQASQLLSKEEAVYSFRVAGGVLPEVKAQPSCSKLQFLGRIPRVEVQREFEQADVFVLPTLAEGSATVVYEAMAAGIPVVTTHAAGSIVRDGVDGIIVPERDAKALAEAVSQIVSDRSMRDSMSAAARERAKIGTWDRYQNDLVDMIKALPGKPR